MATESPPQGLNIEIKNEFDYFSIYEFNFQFVCLKKVVAIVF